MYMVHLDTGQKGIVYFNLTHCCKVKYLFANLIRMAKMHVHDKLESKTNKQDRLFEVMAKDLQF